MEKKVNSIFTCLAILVTLLIFSCTPTQTNLDKEHEEIMALHDLQREVHFNKDSVKFANLLSDNYVSVNKGAISYPTTEELISRYHSYFSAVEFIRWDDVSEPIIRLSDDGKLAYTVVDKVVELTYETLEGETVTDTTYYAWTSIYKKYPEGWKIDSVTSTEKAK